MPRVALSDTTVCGNAEVDRAVASAGERTQAIVRVCLLFVLMYATDTVFVRSAWAHQSFQIGVSALVAVSLVAGGRGGVGHFAKGWVTWLLYLVPVWGVFQLLAHTTASTFETREVLLRWSALVGVFFLSQTAAKSKRAEHLVLITFQRYKVPTSVRHLIALQKMAQLNSPCGKIRQSY